MSIVLRNQKGIALTYDEADENWDFLDRTKHDKLDESYSGIYQNPQIVVDDSGQIISIEEGVVEDDSSMLVPGVYRFSQISVDDRGVISDIVSEPVSDVSAGVYGNATNVPIITVDSAGRISDITTQTVTDVAEVVESIVPAGIIVMWNGTIETIPSGWALCDGTNGTPDLRDRFIVGKGNIYLDGETGGSADSVVVSHSHEFSATTSPNGLHSHTVRNGTGGIGNSGLFGTRSNQGSFPYDQSTSEEPAHEHTVSGTTDIEGESGINKNLPPYYALAYIMKTA